jgi:hypothetical protein
MRLRLIDSFPGQPCAMRERAETRITANVDAT